LLAFQFAADIQNGAVPIEHLLVLVGLAL
jgi:hypothetical protein